MATDPFHPELKLARFLPRTVVTAWNLRFVRALTPLAFLRAPKDVGVVELGDGVSIRLWRPPSRSARSALLWVHGGGMVMGTAAQDDGTCRRVAHDLDVLVGAVEYRLAPENPFPVPLEDCYRALSWLAAQPGVERIAIGGASAGGGLAAGLALLARERAEIALVAQILIYPMLDDRTADRSDIDATSVRMWNAKSNRFGWDSYLGSLDRADVSPLAAPSRAVDLDGLPPAWVGVGTKDLFHDESVCYAQRLQAAGVPCELRVVSGGYHAFDVIEARAEVSRSFTKSWTEFLANRLK